MTAGAGRITAISSMATRAVLAELAQRYRRDAGAVVDVVSVGGVDAVRRVRDGEAFDAAILADDAIGALEREGALVAGSRVAIACCGIAVAVGPGSALPRLDSEEDVRHAVLSAPSIGLSTGPSGAHLAQLLERWGIAAEVAARLVQAPPGVPVASLVASGQARIGFQQLSELTNVEGIRIAGSLPPAIQLTTVFAGALCAKAQAAAAARAWLAFAAAPSNDEVRVRHGMQPCAGLTPR